MSLSSAAALTLSVAPPLTAPLVAVTMYVPALVGLQVALLAQPASELLALQVGLITTALPYWSAPAAAKVWLWPAWIEAAGVTVIEASAAALTLSVAPPLIAPLVAVTVYVPALVGAQVALLAQPASALLADQVGVMVTALPY